MSVELKEKMAVSLKAARSLAEKAEAEGRDLTDVEAAQAKAHLQQFEADKVLLGKAQKGAAVKAQLAAIGNPIGDSAGGGGNTPERSRGRKSGRGGRWAEKAGEALTVHGLAHVAASPGGTKALLSGSISVPNLLDGGEPVEIEARRRTLLDLVGRGVPAGERLGNEFFYLRQTQRENNAAAIADGKNKPTSVYGFGEVSDHYRTYVNKTEDLPYRYLSDYDKLIDVVEKQLAEDTMVAIEHDMLSGTGPDAASGEDAFVGILETSGIQVQTWATDLLTTLSNAKHKFIAQEMPFNGWVLNPADLQKLELMRENGATGKFLFGSQAAIEDFLGAPIVPTVGMPAGKALVGDFDQAEIIPLGDDELVVDTGKRTTNNTFLLMFEGRYGFRVKKASAFVEVDTTA